MERKIGFITGVFGLFHIGHLNILRQSHKYCDYLIVACAVDEFVKNKKGKYPFIPFGERIQILEAIKYIDKVVPQIQNNKLEMWKKFQFNIIFVGDDWKGTQEWNEYEEAFPKIGVELIYFPYTRGISSSQLREIIEKSLEL
ncbi:Glycerol-3-phosphate cytidylyltransferase [termite gut metagenome]|uniref:Glycerol-3-phosphate cytidylyltransferase n=1 Tax=termite gut metagenome TaxID=433724 RepID=A0A5J4R1J6_9ZZZZ